MSCLLLHPILSVQVISYFAAVFDNFTSTSCFFQNKIIFHFFSERPQLTQGQVSIEEKLAGDNRWLTVTVILVVSTTDMRVRIY